jgi:hypothetical protein
MYRTALIILGRTQKKQDGLVHPSCFAVVILAEIIQRRQNSKYLLCELQESFQVQAFRRF